ncbi:MAG: SpoIIE family protein phosphatase [Gemmatimonadaceae bacterium]|nr:SpoIIE family protein phosphatase [Gemmatimonadaceae bacterium]NUQ92648.1 SpoIIE family protein phosphatase [Gemmatimonadaceae bacterium]NUR18211.1 SpoIIE family protein phosphatase [Gemmatimonadaceae bacterium]
MKELDVVLTAFREATGCEAAVWLEGPNGRLVATASSNAGASPPPFPPAHTEPPRRVITARGEMLVTAISGPRAAWLAIGPCGAGGAAELDAYRRFLLPVVTQYLQSALEVEHAAAELAERYEEINLLYTISEILGRAVTLEETAVTILEEVSGTVGARRASILVHDRVTDTLNVVAALGVVAAEAPPIAVDDPNSVSARVFREQHLRIVEEGEMLCDAERPYRKGAMMSVPIMWTSPTGGSEPLGVVNLSGRHGDQPFTAGDQKLMAAIATQIGTAIQNARLVRSSLNQQKLLQEMQLAHDLQMKLLPRADVVAPEATVSARVIPAESVGGDFYNLFRLGEGRTGVMIGDVSSHGYRAALIMALTMSATAIHAQRTSDPAQTLDALLHSVRDELESTEMFVSVFYGVVDPAAERLRYSNTGHPHAFVIGANGSCERLPALDPPLGMVPDAPAAQERPWASGEDLLLLFTDGISDARGRDGERLGEQAVLETVLKHRAEEPSEIVEHVFEILRQHMGDTPRRDDLTLVVLRS